MRTLLNACNTVCTMEIFVWKYYTFCHIAVDSLLCHGQVQCCFATLPFKAALGFTILLLHSFDKHSIFVATARTILLTVLEQFDGVDAPSPCVHCAFAAASSHPERTPHHRASSTEKKGYKGVFDESREDRLFQFHVRSADRVYQTLVEPH